MKKYLRFLPVLVVAVVVASVLHFSSPGTHLPSWLNVGMGDAYAGPGDTSGPSHFGNGVSNGCAGVFPQPSAGVGATQAPCLNNYANVGCAVVSLATPGAGNFVNCGKTAVATITVVGTASATVTAPGVQILYGTANANATAVWFGIN